MLFNSYLFIFIFFPLCITGYYLLLRGGRVAAAKIWLIGCSLWFYGFYSASYLLIMVLSIALNRLLTVLLWINDGSMPRPNGRLRFSDPERDPKTLARVIMITGVTLNLALLGYFKYLDFLIQNLTFITGHDFPLKNIVLPLGISFFTFQQIGYLVDVYRGDAKPSHILDHILFVAFFPQLVAGPIVTQEEMMPQFGAIGHTVFDPDRFSRSLTLFIMGLAKKVIIADTLGAGVDLGYSMIGGLSGIDALLVICWYALQLYFDFSGYSDMAMGLAGMLMIDLPVNFDSPYKSRNILEFWKRWHRTLTRFFTNYVYIPLGGNRKGTLRMVLNILIVYFLSGLWHGAGWNFVLWGMLHGAAYAITRLIHNAYGRDELFPKPVSVALTFVYVSLCWVFFRAPSTSDALQLIGRLFTGGWGGVNYQLATAVVPDEIWYVFKALGTERIGYVFARNAAMAFVSIAALAIAMFAPGAVRIRDRIRLRPLSAAVFGAIGAWCVLMLSGVSRFLYFNF